MKDLIAVAFLTISEIIGCFIVATILAVVYSCSLSSVITPAGAGILLMLCCGMSIIGVALSHHPGFRHNKKGA